MSIHKENSRVIATAKECAFLGTFVAITIAIQLALSFVPNVELVTVLFVSYSFVMGVRRGLISAVAFSLLRQIIFGFYPSVLILYLAYYSMLTTLFGVIGKRLNLRATALPILAIVVALCSIMFTMLDNVITPLWFALTLEAAKAYFLASLPFMLIQMACAVVSVIVLFLPIAKVFAMAKERL